MAPTLGGIRLIPKSYRGMTKPYLWEQVWRKLALDATEGG